MKLSTYLTGALLSLMLAAGTAGAAGTNNIAAVNVAEIMQKSTAAQSIKEQIDAKKKTFQAEMTKKEEQLNSEEQEIRKQRAVLSPEAVEKKIKAFKTKAGNAQKDVQEKRSSLENGALTAEAQIQKAVFDIIAEMAKEKGYIAVIPTSMMLWSDASLDITKDVLAKLNSTLPDVKVTFREAASADKE